MENIIDESFANTANLVDGKNSDNKFRFIDGRRFHNIKHLKYPLPNDDEEYERLNYQHATFRCLWQGNFTSPVKKVLDNSESKAKVLDVGCGNASWIFDMAREYPDATFIGLDILPDQPESTKLSNAAYVQHNVLDGLPFEDSTFDFIHQRLSNSSFPKQKWMFVINELVRILKPGGYLEIMDVEVRMRQAGPAMQRFYDAINEMMIMNDFDTDLYHNVRKYFAEQGELENINQVERKLIYGNKVDELGRMVINSGNMFHNGLKQALTPILKTSSKELDDLFESSAKELNELNCYRICFRVYANKKNNSLN
ncbi:S-adenosyl-L-methionine-dependent methyltransferase [Gigaspora rosea]|uniref:S-adenosyl-L-methionine-dependent methyltransferase n=1 Tax=Gigaspora rosea TaxID=44941 RepID=A0A397UR51_9GLOM|nr:S-adenosyl-L-methionine-dependent methyltransferase [Gigaspora rosea]